MGTMMSLFQRRLSEGGVDAREVSRWNMSSYLGADLDHQPCADHPKGEVLDRSLALLLMGAVLASGHSSHQIGSYSASESPWDLNKCAYNGFQNPGDAFMISLRHPWLQYIPLWFWCRESMDHSLPAFWTLKETSWVFIFEVCSCK